MRICNTTFQLHRDTNEKLVLYASWRELEIPVFSKYVGALTTLDHLLTQVNKGAVEVGHEN